MRRPPRKLILIHAGFDLFIVMKECCNNDTFITQTIFSQVVNWELGRILKAGGGGGGRFYSRVEKRGRGGSST